MHQRTLDLGFPTQSEPELCEMENGGQWELPEARSEALRRRLVAEEQAVERSQGRSASIDRPEAHDPIEDDWDPFCPLDYELMTGLTKKPTVPDAEAEANQRRAAEASELAWKKYKAEEEKSEEYEWSQRYAIEASQFRDEWNTIWSRYYGPYEAITEIPNMRFTHEPAPRGANPCNSLQIFAVKVTELGGGLQWPLDVFGMVAVRDTIDKRRNIVFDRKRDNCQTLTEKDPCLVLTGPSRVVVQKDPVTIEAELVVKGTVESEDKILSYLAVEPMIYGTLYSELLIRDYPSKLSTLEFTLGHMFIAVEATIFLQVVDGSWPDGFSGRFVACTASIDQEVVLLFHSGDKIFPCTDDGNVKLSRCVASVEVNGKLQVSVKAWKVDNSGKSKTELFMSEKADEDYLQEVGVCAPTLADSSIEKKWFSHQKKSGRSDDTLDVGFCKIKVDVAWSVIWLDLA